MAQRVAREAKGGPPAAPSADDQWQAQVTRAAALAIGEWLSSAPPGMLDRQVRTLTIQDLEAMAVAAISQWIKEWSGRLDDAPAPILNLLLGS